MEGFKEFEGKSLDLAIREACEYYNAVREKLEIEIIQDAKSGIFGLVGARKAKIRARRAALREAVASALGKTGRRTETVEPAAPAAGTGGEASRPPRSERNRPRRAEGEAADNRRPRAPRKAAARTPAAAAAVTADDARPAPRPADETDVRTQPAPASQPAVGEAPAPDAEARSAVVAAPSASVSGSAGDAVAAAGDDAGAQTAAQIDPERLAALTVEAVERLVRPIAGDGMVLKAEVLDGRVRVAVEGAEDSGLLIGREGQTLAALQYLASRIVSRAVNAAVRVQLDASRYRQRQDEKLREIALALAERVRQTGRSFSTRPLSSYHRRIVHLTLQDAPDVQTRSTGEGPLKRVVICRRRPERGQA